jgi:hypothetical protein
LSQSATTDAAEPSASDQPCCGVIVAITATHKATVRCLYLLQMAHPQRDMVHDVLVLLLVNVPQTMSFRLMCTSMGMHSVAYAPYAHKLEVEVVVNSVHRATGLPWILPCSKGGWTLCLSLTCMTCTVIAPQDLHRQVEPWNCRGTSTRSAVDTVFDTVQ